MRLELIAQLPSSPSQRTPLLFVHGGWHAAWCWEHFLPWFAARGHAAYALSLRGHGASDGRAGQRWHRVADYVEDLRWAVDRLPSAPVIVGHSMGGYVAQKYLEAHAAPGAVLMASIPPHGLYRFAARLALRHPALFLMSHLRLDARHVVGTPALVREAFFSASTPEETVLACHRRLTGASFRIELDALFAALPDPARITVPMLVLAARGDRLFSVAEQRRTARAYGTEAEEFDMGHDMMLEPGWEQVAARILEWMSARGL